MVVPFVAGAMRGFPQMMGLLNAPKETTVTIEVASTAWTLRHDPEGWGVYDGRPATPTVALEMAPIAASGVISRGLTADEIRSVIGVSGDTALAGQLVEGMALFFGR
jgi:hypothetical protein